jgi:ABC-type spermidine/putrescine transport system permease subunit II
LASIGRRWWFKFVGGSRFLAALLRSFIVAGAAAGFAVHEAILANADIELRLAEAAELFALALRLRALTLRATVIGVAGSSGHRNNVTLDT